MRDYQLLQAATSHPLESHGKTLIFVLGAGKRRMPWKENDRAGRMHSGDLTVLNIKLRIRGVL